MDDSALEASYTCTTLRAHMTAYLALGGIAYRYNHEIRWCWDGDTILSVPEDYDFLSDVNWAFQWEGTASESSSHYSWGGDPNGRFRSYMQGEVRNCIPDVGCLSTFYPWITLNVYADGHHKADGYA